MKIIRLYGIIISLLLAFNLWQYHLESGISFLKVPIEDLPKILVGPWKFKTKITGAMTTQFFEGEVQYNADGTFARYMTCKVFYISLPGLTKETYHDYKADLVINGYAKGNWKIGDGEFWEETVEECNMEVDYCSGDCQKKLGLRSYGRKSKFTCYGFDPDVTVEYGNFQDESHRVKLKRLSKWMITLETLDFEDYSKGAYTFRRKRS